VNKALAKAGTLLSVESGCYSDYGVIGFFVVLKDFTPAAELDDYISTRPDQQGTYSFRESEFLAFILAKGLLLEINYGKLHLGDYSRIGEVEYYPSSGEGKS
jgi:hypothetical protein